MRTTFATVLLVTFAANTATAQAPPVAAPPATVTVKLGGDVILTSPLKIKGAILAPQTVNGGKEWALPPGTKLDGGVPFGGKVAPGEVVISTLHLPETELPAGLRLRRSSILRIEEGTKVPEPLIPFGGGEIVPGGKPPTPEQNLAQALLNKKAAAEALDLAAEVGGETLKAKAAVKALEARLAALETSAKAEVTKLRKELADALASAKAYADAASDAALAQAKADATAKAAKAKEHTDAKVGELKARLATLAAKAKALEAKTETTTSGPPRVMVWSSYYGSTTTFQGWTYRYHRCESTGGYRYERD